jgi:photosystem II stability/assembly factor-like uncharacterized protein
MHKKFQMIILEPAMKIRILTRERSLFAVLSLLLLLAQGAAGQTWTGGGPHHKVIKAIAISPQDTSVIYAGAFGSGIFKSTDAGASWLNSRTGLTNGYVRSVVALSNTLVFCGTNDGVSVTTDGGLTWTTSLTTPFSVRSLAYDVQQNSLYAASFGAGLFKSINQGLSWNSISVTDPVVSQTLSHLWSIALFGHDSLYVGGSLGDVTTGGALFRSLDGGTSWIQVQRGLHFGSSVHSIAINPAAPAVNLIVGTATKGVYRSTNGGLNWSNISDTTSVLRLPDLNINAVAFSKSFRYAGTDSLGGFYSRSPVDATVGWTAGGGLPGRRAVVSSITLNPTNNSTVYLGTEGEGIFRSTNSGSGWSSRNTGMLGIAARVIRKNSDGHLILGSDFGDGIWISTNSGGTWSQETSLTTANAITSIAITGSASLLYAGAYGSGVYKSTDAGITWVITDSTTINRFVRALNVAPANSNLLFAGTDGGVYKTVNGGASWQASSGGIPPGTSIRCMTMDPADPNVLYAGTDSLYMYKTTDGGVNWAHYTNANGFLPQDIFIRTITVDYTNSNTLYAGSDSGRVYKSTSAGTSWILHSQISATHSVRSVLIHPGDHRIFFAATFGDGVFVSADSGSHWVPMSSGLVDLDIYTLEGDGGNPLTIYAGSSDSGVYHTSYSIVNHAPALAPIGNRTTIPNKLLSIPVSASDVDGTIPSLSASGLPAGASFIDSLNGRGSFMWTPSGGQIGSHLMTFYASDGALTDSQKVTIQVLDSTAVETSVAIEPGWNLLSLPLLMSDSRKKDLFPQAISSAFGYNGSYHITDTLQNGAGYWLKFSAGGTSTLAGSPVVRETLAVGQGWNLIGSVTQTIPANFVTPIPPVVRSSSPLGYGSIPGYFVADSIVPGKAYWLRVNQAGKIVISSTPSAIPGIPSGAAGIRAGVDRTNIGELSFTDPAGRTRTLLLFAGTPPGVAGDEFELPPVPPEGAFDVRFSRTQSSAALIDLQATKQTYPILISGQASSVMLHWKLSEPRLRLDLTVGNGEESSTVLLAGQGSLPLPAGTGATQAILGATMGDPPTDHLPHEITLRQNYPNPFNPTTTIEYFLPFSARVRLVVFDLLGNEVKEILNGNQEAGYHQARWNAEHASSGVYYYRLEAENPTDPAHAYRVSMKMFLIR